MRSKNVDEIEPRSCDNPAPENGGFNCPGNNTETGPCNEFPCPISTFTLFFLVCYK